MAQTSPTLHMICGKIGAGKSTLAAQLAQDTGALVIAEDKWLAALFSDQLATLQDYVRCSAKLRVIMGPHVAGLLNAGVSVVLDYQANTLDMRTWMRSILDAAQADHRMHVLTTPDAVCRERLRARNAAGDHPFAATEAQFHQASKYYVAPSPEEGFTLVMHDT